MLFWLLLSMSQGHQIQGEGEQTLSVVGQGNICTEKKENCFLNELMWLGWISVVARRNFVVSCRTFHRGAQSLWLWLVGLDAPQHVGSWFPDQGSNLLPLHCKADSYPLDYQGRPSHLCRQFTTDCNRIICFIQTTDTCPVLTYFSISWLCGKGPFRVVKSETPFYATVQCG